MNAVTQGERRRIAVVIPAYQAAASIAAVIAGIPAWVETIIVVDDGSADETAETARGAGDPRVQVARHRENRGVGAAMATGYRLGLDAGAEVLVKMDADGQMDPEQLAGILEPVLSGRADYAKGNRFHSRNDLTAMPALRLLGNAALSFLTKLSSGAWHVFDPANGYTAIHRDALLALDRRRLHRRYFFESSMLVSLTVARAVIEDVPIPARYGSETSHLSVWRALVQFPLLHLRYAIWRFVKLYLLLDFNACSLLTLLGTPLMLFGLAQGAWVWYRSSVTATFASTGTVMLPTLAIIVGFQMLLHALLLDVGNAPRRPLQQRPRLAGGDADQGVG
jgi:glycosyltransferase involved in cell wall biosynthesis